MFEACDVVMEFSVPMATIAHAPMAAKHGTAHVIGTTGLNAEQEAVLAKAAEKTCIMYAPNMSVIVNLLFALVEQVSGLLGTDYDIEVMEMHHKHKIDAPSGTAVGLGQAAARGPQGASAGRGPVEPRRPDRRPARGRHRLCGIAWR